jgi:hypothetical protein
MSHLDGNVVDKVEINSVALVLRKRTIPIERLPVGEVSANYCR